MLRSVETISRSQVDELVPCSVPVETAFAQGLQVHVLISIGCLYDQIIPIPDLAWGLTLPSSQARAYEDADGFTTNIIT